MDPNLTPIDLARQFGQTFQVPVFLVDLEGNLLYFNKAAGEVLGRTFEETGSMSAGVWSRIFLPTDESGSPLDPEKLPLMVALTEGKPATGKL
jgi:PAS domain-containing protein